MTNPVLSAGSFAPTYSIAPTINHTPLIEPSPPELSSATPSITVVNPTNTTPNKRLAALEPLERPWFETVNLASLDEPIDLSTGSMRFSLPLVQIDKNPLMTLALAYIGTDSLGTVGKGWVIPENKVEVQFNQSLFLEDHTFSVAIMGSLFSLKIKEVKADEYICIAVGVESLTGKFSLKNNQWQFSDKEGTKWTFGGSQAYAEQLFGVDWNGEGIDESTKVPKTTSWYLTKVEDPKGLITDFSYDTSTSHNKALRLTTIANNLDSKIVCAYGQQFLEGITVTTLGYKQSLQLKYNSEKRLYTILQGQSKLVEFSYDSTKISTIKVHKDFELNKSFTYGEHNLVCSPIVKKVEEVSQLPFLSAFSSGDYYARAFINANRKVDLAILKQNDLSPISSKEINNIGNQAVEEVALFGTEDFLSLVLRNEKGNQLYTLQRNPSGLWSTSDKYIGLSANVSTGSDYLLDLGNKAILVWDNSNQQYQSFTGFAWNAHSDTVAVCLENHFFVYDNSNLWMGSREISGQWSAKTILEEKGAFEAIKAMSGQFAPLMQQEADLLKNLKALTPEPDKVDFQFIKFLHLFQLLLNVSEENEELTAFISDKRNQLAEELKKAVNEEEARKLYRNAASLSLKWIDFTYDPTENRLKELLAFFKDFSNQYPPFIEKFLRAFQVQSDNQKIQLTKFFKKNLLAATESLAVLSIPKTTKTGFACDLKRLRFLKDGVVEESLTFSTENLAQLTQKSKFKEETDEEGSKWRTELIFDGPYCKVRKYNASLTKQPYENNTLTLEKEFSFSEIEDGEGGKINIFYCPQDTEFQNYSFKCKYTKHFAKDNDSYKITWINEKIKEDLQNGHLVIKQEDKDGNTNWIKPFLNDNHFEVKNGDYFQPAGSIPDNISALCQALYTDSNTISAAEFLQLFEIKSPLPFCLNRGFYLTAIASNNVVAAGHRLTFTGKAWNDATLDEDELGGEKSKLLLGTEFILEKEKDKSFQLFKQNDAGQKGELLNDLGTTKIDEVLPIYPLGIVYKQMGEIWVYSLKNLNSQKIGPGTLVTEGCSSTVLMIESNGEITVHSLWPYLAPKTATTLDSITTSSSSINYGYDAPRFLGVPIFGKVKRFQNEFLQGYETFYLDNGHFDSIMPTDPSGKSSPTSSGKISYDSQGKEVARNYFSARPL